MKKFFAPILAALGALFFLAACASAPEKRYPIQAEVVSADAPRKMIVVSHGEIPGLMPAMTMGYMVAEPKEIEGLGPGDKITADLVVSDNKGQLEKIVLVKKAGKEQAPAAAPAVKTKQAPPAPR
ncbi:MAG: copper-binding protein [Acidobacteriia bacterium]|nr:copper-binding protein [Terriglobia bacterium]